MKRTHFIVLALFCAAFVPAFALPGRADLQTMYIEYLQDEGYSPKVDEDGDVSFKREGRTFYIIVDEKDLEFFRIVYPNFWPIESDDERDMVALAASYANRRTKVAKAYIDGDDTWIAAEIYIAEPGDFGRWVPRMMNAIQTALDHFKARVRELEGD